MKHIFYSILCTILLCTPVFAQIKVPDKVDSYKPVIAESTTDAQVYVWQVRLATKTVTWNTDSPIVRISVNNNKTQHIWAEPGKYEVNLTAINVDWEKKEITYNEHFAQFEVLDRSAPDPPVPPVPVPSAFKDKVKSAVSKVDQAALSYKVKVAEVYAGIAAEAEATPTSWDAALMLNEAKVRNATVLPSSVLTGWAGFWPPLAKALQELNLKPEDLKGHITAFKEIAEVLKQ
jgi:hypothetical protein